MCKTNRYKATTERNSSFPWLLFSFALTMLLKENSAAVLYFYNCHYASNTKSGDIITAFFNTDFALLIDNTFVILQKLFSYNHLRIYSLKCITI